jgi:ubiquinone/menaquinone biosynthesis C-methylase UbiE
MTLDPLSFHVSGIVTTGNPTMTESSAYEASARPGGLDYEVGRLRRQALMAWDKEARALEWLGLRDGMSFLELGAGPGFITEQVLVRYPSSHVTVVEIDPVLVERSGRYLKGKADDRLRIIEGSVMAMDLPDNSYDFAFGRLLFQHLPDPVGAAREVLRVLRPGGTLVIEDIDEKSHIFEPPATPEAEAIMKRFIAEHAARGGNRNIGHHLPRLLKQSGYVNLDLELVAAHSDVVGLAALDHAYHPNAWKPELEEGLITQEEYETLSKFDEVFYASDPLVMIVLYLASGEKPR